MSDKIRFRQRDRFGQRDIYSTDQKYSVELSTTAINIEGNMEKI